MRKTFPFIALIFLTIGIVQGAKQPRILAICRIEFKNSTCVEAIYSVYEQSISSCFSSAIQISEGNIFPIDIDFKVMRFSYDSITEKFMNFEYFDQESIEGYRFEQVRQIQYLKNCMNEMGFSYPGGYVDTVSLLGVDYILFSPYVHLFIPQDYITVYCSLSEQLKPIEEIKISLKDIKSFEFITTPSSYWTDLICAKRKKLTNLDYYPSFYHELYSDSLVFNEWRTYLRNECHQ